MIQVQIASNLERTGVAGVRWVLVEPTARAPEVASAPPAAAAAGMPAPLPGAPVRRATLGVHLACGAVLLVALGAAWWVVDVMQAPASLGTAAAAAAR